MSRHGHATTLNFAGILAQPSDDTGAPLPGVDPVLDLAVAQVQVLRPGITIDKTALVGVVLDAGAVLPPGAPPDGRAVQGPDVPTPRPAEYLYEVTNTGNVELSPRPAPRAGDDICGPLVFAEGDTDGDELLDVDETWRLHVRCGARP